jgi:NmrA-like family protein
VADEDRGVVVVAGPTGNLGGKIVDALLDRGATVRAIVRSSSPPDRVAALRARGALPCTVDYSDAPALSRACEGAGCVVSALSGLRETIVDAQTRLLEGAVAAGVPRFIPSDFAIDFPKLPAGGNRNFDLRREFASRLDRASIAATSILCGAFTELLIGPAPIVLFPIRRVLYWGDADQVIDFTTRDDTAAFTAAAALDASTPRFLRIAGESTTARGLVAAVEEATGEHYRLLRGGSLRMLRILSRIARALSFDRHSVFPPWQGMQYTHDMFDGSARLWPLDNDRYPGMRWTPVVDVLKRRPESHERRDLPGRATDPIRT